MQIGAVVQGMVLRLDLPGSMAHVTFRHTQLPLAARGCQLGLYYAYHFSDA